MRMLTIVGLVLVGSMAFGGDATTRYRGYDLTLSKVSKKSRISTGGTGMFLEAPKGQEFLDILILLKDSGEADHGWVEDGTGQYLRAMMPVSDIELKPSASLMGPDGREMGAAEKHPVGFERDKKTGRLALWFVVPKKFVATAVRIGRVEFPIK